MDTFKVQLNWGIFTLSSVVIETELIRYKAIDGKTYLINQVEDYFTNMGLLLPDDIDEEEGITIFDNITVYPVYRYTLIGIYGDLNEPLLASENITDIVDVKSHIWDSLSDPNNIRQMVDLTVFTK